MCDLERKSVFDSRRGHVAPTIEDRWFSVSHCWQFLARRVWWQGRAIAQAQIQKNADFGIFFVWMFGFPGKMRVCK
jgi:hypothetical protein